MHNKLYITCTNKEYTTIYFYTTTNVQLQCMYLYPAHFQKFIVYKVKIFVFGNKIYFYGFISFKFCFVWFEFVQKKKQYPYSP